MPSSGIFFIRFIYGHNDARERKEVWDSIRSIGIGISEPCILIGVLIVYWIPKTRVVARLPLATDFRTLETTSLTQLYLPSLVLALATHGSIIR